MQSPSAHPEKSYCLFIRSFLSNTGLHFFLPELELNNIMVDLPDNATNTERGEHGLTATRHSH